MNPYMSTNDPRRRNQLIAAAGGCVIFNASVLLVVGTMSPSLLRSALATALVLLFAVTLLAAFSKAGGPHAVVRDRSRVPMSTAKFAFYLGWLVLSLGVSAWMIATQRTLWTLYLYGALLPSVIVMSIPIRQVVEELFTRLSRRS